eukprot:10939554-Lingulodinium_polyedra.AAC.1
MTQQLTEANQLLGGLATSLADLMASRQTAMQTTLAKSFARIDERLSLLEAKAMEAETIHPEGGLERST